MVNRLARLLYNRLRNLLKRAASNFPFTVPFAEAHRKLVKVLHYLRVARNRSVAFLKSVWLHPKLLIWVDGLIIALRYRNTNERLKLHLGCGRRRLEGYINIDMHRTQPTDYVQDVRRLRFPPGSCNVIESYHLIEQIKYNEVRSVLRHWRDLLCDDGKLIVELPDFDEIILKYQMDKENEQLYLAYIFGAQRFEGDYHCYGYNFERLKALLLECGFTNVTKHEATDYHKNEAPCFRVECNAGK